MLHVVHASQEFPDEPLAKILNGMNNAENKRVSPRLNAFMLRAAAQTKREQATAASSHQHIPTSPLDFSLLVGSPVALVSRACKRNDDAGMRSHGLQRADEIAAVNSKYAANRAAPAAK